jgi:photosystem II stability/assembly factor-like uncharacterized protein
MIIWEGVDISSEVISYERNESLCNSDGSISISIQGDSVRGFTVGDEILLYENGIKKGTYYCHTINRTNPEHFIILTCSNAFKQLQDYFVIDQTKIETDGEVAKTYIIKYLEEACVNYNIYSPGNGGYIAKDTQLGLDSALNIISRLCTQAGWYLWFDEDNTAQIGKIGINVSGYTLKLVDTDILSINEVKDDKMLRNRVVVWGKGDALNNNWIYQERKTLTPWSYDSKDYRTIVVQDSNIRNNLQASRIATNLLRETKTITDVKEILVEGFLNINLTDTVLISSKYYNGRGLVTNITSTESIQGRTTLVTLDFRCPRLLGTYEYDGHVYIGTESAGIWRKHLSSGIWENFSAGLTDLNVKDLYINNGLFVTVAGDYLYTRELLDSSWTKFYPTGFTTISGGTFSLSQVSAVACAINQVTNEIYGAYTAIPSGGYSWYVSMTTPSNYTINQIREDNGNEDITIVDFETNTKDLFISAQGNPSGGGSETVGSPVATFDFWKPLDVPYGDIGSVCSDSTGNTLLFCKSPNSFTPTSNFYLSTDRGTTWDELTVSPQPLKVVPEYYVDLAMDDSATILMAEGNISTDGGANWIRPDMSSYANLVRDGHNAVDSSGNYIIFAAYDNVDYDDFYIFMYNGGDITASSGWDAISLGVMTTVINYNFIRNLEITNTGRILYTAWKYASSVNESIYAIDYGETTPYKILTTSNSDIPSGSSFSIYNNLGISADGSVIGCLLKLGASDNRLYISTDGGTSWTRKLSTTISSGSIYATNVAISDNGQTIVVTWYKSGHYVYISTDGGNTWYKNGYKASNDVPAFNTLVISSDGTKLASSIGSGFFYIKDLPEPTTNGNYIWEKVLPDNSVAVYDWPSINSDGSVIIAANTGTPKGITRSEDSGNSWESIDPFGSPTYINNTAIDYTGQVIAVCSNNKVRYSQNGGSSWSDVFSTPPLYKYWSTVCLNSTGNTIIGAIYSGRIYISTNSGVSYSEIRPKGDANGNWVVVTCSEDGSVILALEYGYLYVSIDSGANWTLTDPSGWGYISAEDVAISPDGTQILIAESGDYLCFSQDSGATWEFIYPPVGDDNRFNGTAWNSLAISNDPAKIVAVGGRSYVYTSTDKGVTWKTEGLEILPLSFYANKVAANPTLEKIVILTRSASYDIYYGELVGIPTTVSQVVYKKIGASFTNVLTTPYDAYLEASMSSPLVVYNHYSATGITISGFQTGYSVGGMWISDWGDSNTFEWVNLSQNESYIFDARTFIPSGFPGIMLAQSSGWYTPNPIGRAGWFEYIPSGQFTIWPVYNNFTPSGVTHIETSNYTFSGMPFIFLATSGVLPGFYQQNIDTEGFIDYSSGMPNSAVTIIRVDDSM